MRGQRAKKKRQLSKERTRKRRKAYHDREESREKRIARQSEYVILPDGEQLEIQDDA